VSREILIAGSFIAYLLVVGAIGLAAYRRTHDSADFILGRRRLSYWISALSAGASDMSGWLLLGLPGLAYVAGGEALFLALGLFVGTYLNWRFIARPLRVYTERYGDALTLPEYFEHRFDDRTHSLRRVSAICILGFFAFYTAAGFVAGGKLFSASFGVPYETAVIAGASLIVAYTAFGGFLAVSWTDALQAGLMFFALVVVAVLALDSRPDSPVTANAISVSGLSSMTIASALAWGLGYFGQPHILARFMAIRDPDSVASARRLATAWTGIALVCAIAVGIAGHWVLPAELLADDRETVFIHLLEILLHPLVAGVCLAGILAAIMSTADSQLLVAAAALTHDLLPSGRRSQTASLRWHRGTVGLICLVALSIALRPDSGVLALVAYAWAGFGATIGPAVVMSLYSPRTSKRSVLAGMLAGAACVVGWEHLEGGLFDLYGLLPGFCVGLGVMLTCNIFCLSRRSRTVLGR